MKAEISSDDLEKSIRRWLQKKSKKGIGEIKLESVLESKEELLLITQIILKLDSNRKPLNPQSILTLISGEEVGVFTYDGVPTQGTTQLNESDVTIINNLIELNILNLDLLAHLLFHVLSEQRVVKSDTSFGTAEGRRIHFQASQSAFDQR